MKILNILHDSIVDGVGLRTVIFFAGCPHRCKSCHNPQSWNVENGIEYKLNDVISEIKSNKATQGVTFSGGDPFYQARNILPLAKELKGLGYNLWVYSGYTYEEIIKDEDMTNLLKCCDVLVDGRFAEEQKDLSLPFRGSKNQRVINIQESIIKNEICLHIK